MMVAKKNIRWYVAGALALFFLAAYLLPLAARPMMRPDEFRYAEIPREMLVSGDWTVPRFVGFRYFEKPVLGYQLTALSFLCFGENAFAVRLPSALAVLLSGMMLYFLLARKNRDPWLPGLATVIYFAFGLVFGVGTFAVLDSQLTAALTLCIGSFYLAYDTPDWRRRTAWLAAAGIFAGAAFLLKGFLAFAVPAVTVAPFLLWRREWKKLFTYPWLPLVLAVAVAAPWAWAIWRAEPDFWRYFFIEEHWKRFTSSTYDRDPQPFWYFIPVLLGGMMPSGLLALAVWKGWARTLLRRPLIQYMLCWTVMPFLLFSVSSCKMGTYILPCFPPLAALLAIGLRRAMLIDPAWCRRVLAGLFGAFGMILAIASIPVLIALAVWSFLPGVPQLYLPGNFFPYLTVLYLGGYGFWLWRWRRRYRAIVLFLFGLAPVVILGLCSIPEKLIRESKAPEPGLRACLSRFEFQPDDVIASDRNGASAVAWMLKRSDLLLLGRMGEFEYAISNYPDSAARFYPAAQFPALLEKIRPRRLVYIVLRAADDDAFPKEWPARQVVSAHGVTIAVF